MSANLDLARLVYGNPEAFFERARTGRLDVEAFYYPGAIVDISEFDIPGLGGVHHGYEAIREFWRGWTASWDLLTWTGEVYERDPFVVADILMRGTGEASGITVDLPHSQLLFFVKDRVMYQRMFLERHEGFEAARMPTPDPPA